MPDPGTLPLDGLPGADPSAALIERLQRELRTVAALEVCPAAFWTPPNLYLGLCSAQGSGTCLRQGVEGVTMRLIK